MAYKDFETQKIALRKYYDNNREKLQEIAKKYRKSERGKKLTLISSWRRRGIIDEDLSAVYDYYIKQTNCMICLTEFRNSMERNLDHDHLTGEIRYICCRSCNTNLLRE